jgi:hypothetical protein
VKYVSGSAISVNVAIAAIIFNAWFSAGAQPSVRRLPDTIDTNSVAALRFPER